MFTLFNSQLKTWHSLVRVAHTRAVLRSRSDHFNIPELRSRSDHHNIYELSSRSERIHHSFHQSIAKQRVDCPFLMRIVSSVFIILIIAGLEEPKGTWSSSGSPNPPPPDHVELLGYLEQAWCTRGSPNQFRVPSFPFLWKTKFSSSSGVEIS